MWETYSLARLAGRNLTRITCLGPTPASSHGPKAVQDPDGAYSARANSITALQRRGAVYLTCHNAIWELCEMLVARDNNPDQLSVETMCAGFTNHLIPGVIVTPGSVGVLVELGTRGFAYAR